jgi:hypothetical protein
VGNKLRYEDELCNPFTTTIDDEINPEDWQILNDINPVLGGYSDVEKIAMHLVVILTLWH